MGEKIRVLYVDDEPTLLELGKAFLERSGDFTVTTATSAPEAIRLLEKEKFDAIISDYQMPEMDGIEFLKHLKGEGNTTPFIIFTGKGREDVVIEALNAGADFYLQKGGESKSQFAELAHKIRHAVSLRQTGEALRESEEQFRTAFEDVAIAMSMTAMDGHLLRVNHAFCSLLGYSREELLKKTFRDITFPEDIQQSSNRINDAIAGKIRNFVAEKRYVRKDGTLVWVLLSSILLKDPEGKPRYFITHVQDITERKQAEDGLRASEKMMRYIVKHDPNAIAVYDRNLHYIAVSDRYLQDYNVMEKDILGKHHYDVFPEMPQKWKDVHQRCLAGAVEQNEDDFFERPDGSITYNRWICLPWYQDDDSIGGIITYTEVTTERKRAEEELKKSEALLKRTGEIARVGGWELDAETLAVSWTEETFHIHEVPVGLMPPLEEAINFFHPDERRKLSDAIQRALTTGEGYDMELRFITAKGKQLWTRTICQPQVVDGKTIRLIGTFQDITERKRAQEALQKNLTLYGGLIETTDTGFVILDQNGKVLEANQEYARLSGHENISQIRGRSVVEWTADYEKEKNAEAVGKCFREGKIRNLEIDYVNAKGRITPIEVNATVVNVDGAPQILSLCRDITDRKKAEEALQKERKRLYDVLETLPVMICLLTPDYHVVFANRSFREKFGESHGRHCYEYCFGRKEPCTFCEAYSVLKTGKPHHWEVTGPDNRCIIDAYDFPFTDDNGSSLILEMNIDITERKRSEEALRESEMRYRALVDNALEAILIFDFSGTALFANHATATLVDVDDPHALIGRNVLEFIAPESRDTVLADFASVKEGRDAYLAQYKVITATGQEKWVEAIGKKIQFGGVPADIVMLRDITGRKRVEVALQTKERQLSSIFNNISESLFFLSVEPDLRFRFISVNQRFLDATGLSENLVAGRYVDEVIPEPSLTLVLENYKQAIRENKIVRWFETTPYPSGIKYGHVAITPIYDGNGRCTNLIGSVHDITELKQIEAALLKSETRYRELIELLPQTVFEIDHNGTVISVNPNGLKSFGYTKEDLENGLSAFQVFAPRDHQRLAENIQRALQGEPSDALEYIAQRKDGSTFPVITYSVPIIHEHTPVGLRGVLVDITERKRAEEALRQANKKLNLLSSITRHDILNQLLALKGYIELSREYLDDRNRLSDFLAKEDKAANTIEHQIRFTKDYQELGIATPAWQHVNKCIRTAMAALPMRAVHVEPDPADPEVYADPLFEKVFYNLMDNALKYGGDHMNTIRISSQESDTSLAIVCEDDGVGISADDKKHIFTRGFGNNTGLGLFLSREILAITGITIAENGTPGKGARFEITVPKGAYRFTGTGEK